MARILIDASGRFILAGARGFLDAQPGANGGPSATTALVLTDFYSSHQYARPVIQRSALSMADPSGPWADVPVLYSFTGGAPSNPQARVVNAAGGAVVKDWTTLTNISVVGSTGLGTLPKVPQGGFYLLQLRDGQQPANAATTSNGSKSWGVGVVFLAVGQSNMLGTLSAGDYTDVVPGAGQSEYSYWFAGSANATQFGTSGYLHPNNNGNPSGGSSVSSLGGGTFSTMRIVAAALAVKYGKTVPVAFVPWAESGKDIDELAPDGTVSSPLFNGAGTTAGTIGMKSPGNFFGGDFEGMVWHQGESSEGKDRATYLARLKGIYTNLLARVAPFGRDANDLFFLPAVLGPYASVTQVEGKRGAVLDLDAYARANGWPRVRAGWCCIDLDPRDGNDGLHFIDVAGGNQYRRWSVKRLTQAILYQLGCSTFTGVGPRITGITRAGNVLTVTVAHDGGAALVARKPGQPITGWSVKDKNGAAVTVTATIATATTVTLTLSGSPVYPVSVQHCGGVGPDVSNLIVDDKPYPEGCTGIDLMTNGRPLLPTPDSVQVP